jgi:hypothetical protein
MNKLLTITAALAATTLAPAASSQTSPAPVAAAQIDWKAAARADVEAAYQGYVANHPGMHDPANPDFPRKLERARDEAMKVAEATTDRAGYVEALGVFSAELQDGHALAFAKPLPGAAPVEREWPGFIAAWRGEGVVVNQIGPASPVPVGARILSCNGMPVAKLIETRLRTRGLRAKEAGHWWARSQQAFTSSPVFNRNRPKRCRFKTPQGEKEIALAWTPAPPDFDKMLRVASDGERTPIGLSEPRPGLFLIGLPDFQPKEEDVKSYRALFETLRARRAELNRAKAVILDLRHNNGGSSSWSEDTAKALWGDEIVEARLKAYFRDVRIWWRASEGNTSYMSEMADIIRKNGHGEYADKVLRYQAGMRAALAKGEHFYVEEEDEADGDEPATASTATDFTAPVYVIVPGGCASACLDALDAFTRFPNVKLIGAPSSGDSTYMEARAQDLPSGQGRLVIPNKIWVGRPRGSGEFYPAHIELRDNDWSTKAFLERIEADLRTR